jgi:predicted DNA-binding transcriptional regulator AlpA
MRTAEELSKLPNEALVTDQEARVGYVGIGTTAYWGLKKKDPTFPKTVLLGSQKMRCVGDLKTWLAALPTAPAKNPVGRKSKAVQLAEKRDAGKAGAK